MIEPRFRSRAQAFLFFGCAAAVAAVTFSSATVQVSAADAPTFNKDVAPILFEKCATCHRPGAGGPMALTAFSEVRPWARAIKARVTKREMPPWSADPRFGAYTNDTSLSQKQIETIAAWVDGGMPEGTGSAPAMPKYRRRRLAPGEWPPARHHPRDADGVRAAGRGTGADLPCVGQEPVHGRRVHRSAADSADQPPGDASLRALRPQAAGRHDAPETSGVAGRPGALLHPDLRGWQHRQRAERPGRESEQRDHRERQPRVGRRHDAVQRQAGRQGAGHQQDAAGDRGRRRAADVLSAGRRLPAVRAGLGETHPRQQRADVGSALFARRQARDR